MWLSHSVDGVVVLVHSAGVPSDEELAKTCAELSSADCFLPFAYGDSSLSVVHRRRIGQTLARANVTVAAVMEKTLQRRIATAVSWVVRQMRVFAATDADMRRAYDFVDADARVGLAEVIADLHLATGLPAPGVLPQAPRLASSLPQPAQGLATG